MIIIRLILTLALPLLLGYCLVAIIAGSKTKLSLFERLGLSWGIGLGLTGLFMFLISTLGLPVNLLAVAIPIIFILVALVAYAIVNQIKIFGRPAILTIGQTSLADKGLILLIVLTVFYVLFDALVKPIVNFDDLWRQGSIARIIFATGQVITPQTAELAGGHPYLNPLSQAWIYLGLGVWNDAIGKIIFPLCFIALLFIFYSNLRRSSSRTHALLFTYLLTSFPLIVYHAGTAYSDLMQTFYYAGGIIYLFEWFRRQEPPLLLFAALFLGIGNFVKQSGIPLWLVAAFVLFCYLYFERKRNFRPGWIFLLASTIVSAPWLFSRNSFLMSRLLGAASATAEPAFPYGSPTLAGILSHLIRRTFTYADWQILWFVLLLVILLGWRRVWRSELKYLLLIIILDLGIIIYAFFEPNAYQFLVDGTLVNRLMMYPAPVVLFFVALAALPLLNYQPKIGAEAPKQRQPRKKPV